ncbi:MAG TPA: hypothetical protein VF429_09145 [Anaerolineae bacterium]
MTKKTAWVLLIVILLAAFFLREYRLLDFPYHGDEVDEGDIAVSILHGNLAPFYPQNEGNEALYQFVLAPFFATLGDSVMTHRWVSGAWSMVLVALMYVYGRELFHSRRVGVMAAGLAAALWWSTVFGRLGLREISQPVMMTLALLGLIIAWRAPSPRRAMQAGVIGGIFAGLTAYTFLSGRGFPVVVIVFLAYLALVQRAQLRARWRALLVYCVLMIGLTALLLVYLSAHPELDFHVRDLGAQSWLGRGDVTQLAPQIFGTLGMFTVSGDTNWVRNIPGRPVFPGPEAWLFYLGIALCLWRWRKPEYVLQLIVVATFLAPNILADNPPWFTRSIGILPGLLVIPVLPVEWAWIHVKNWMNEWNARRQARVAAASAVVVALLGISIYARTATDMFQTWIDNPGIYWMTLAFYDSAGKYVNQSPDTTPVNYVMDVYTDWREQNVRRVVQRDDVALRFSVLSAFVFPDDPRGNRIAFQIFGAPPGALLEAFLNLDQPIYVDPRVDPQGQRPLHVYFVPRARLDAHLANARTAPVALPDTNAPLTAPLQVGDALQFLGYEILNPAARAGTDLNVLTYWRVLRRPPNLAVFVHLIDSQQHVVAQFDGFEAIVDELAPGDTVVQLHTLSLPANLPSAPYRFELGAYTRDDLKRLPLSSGTDHVWLQSWQPAP